MTVTDDSSNPHFPRIPNMSPLSIVLLCLYIVIVVAVSAYGLHRYYVVLTFLRVRQRTRNVHPTARFADLPHVTVQLPMYNEANVAERIIEAACAIDWPRDRLQIQVLDDSTDHSAEIARACCDRMRDAGHDVQYLHRTHRTGYKAGALEEGMAEATGEFLAVFDADFVPHPDILRRTIDLFTDDDLGMVQVRWGHLNRHDSLLTQIQAMYLDGHFVIEQAARAGSGKWFNFNGTAGIWRRRTIADAGGWQHDTLTEDTDLSYRAQLRGWRFQFISDYQCPAELPPTVPAFMTQQHRWNKGLIQTAIKLLPTIFRSEAPLKNKIEAWFHLTSPVMHVIMMGLVLIIAPAILLTVSVEALPTTFALMISSAFMVLGMFAATTFYLAAQWQDRQPLWPALVRMPALMALGIGMSLLNTCAVLEAVLGMKSGFVRTPKYGSKKDGHVDPLLGLATRRMLPGLAELLIGLVLLGCFAISFVQPLALVGTPFLLLFAVGFLAVGVPRLNDARSQRRLADMRGNVIASPSV
jgi:cellulose synthase/poly-beta-1,6-N-acetylglucosamine synthase-like glycosyltransferase